MMVHVFQYFSYRPNLITSAKHSLMKNYVISMAEFGRLAHGWYRAMDLGILIFLAFLESNITRTEKARLAP